MVAINLSPRRREGGRRKGGRGGGREEGGELKLVTDNLLFI